MVSDPLLLTLLVVTVVVALAAAIAVVVIGSGARRAAERASETAASRHAETLGWVGERLAQTVDRFHSQVGELGRQLGSSQSEAGALVQRSLTEQLQSLAATVNAQLATSQRTLSQGLTGATDVFGKLQARLGEVSEMAARMDQLAGSVRELGNILRVPKLRGLMGEQTLEAMLREVLPTRFWAVQHRFADGRTVDAVVRLGDTLVPVDAKFPLEAFQRMSAATDDVARKAAQREFVRAVKGRVDEIADRYIRPAEGTVDFALMYIPAEGVYAEVVGGDSQAVESLLEYALGKRVLPVSPATIFAYLSVVAAGLHGFEVEAKAQEIIRSIAASGQELARLREELGILGKHLHNAYTRFAEVEKRLDKVDLRLGAAGRVSRQDADADDDDE